MNLALVLVIGGGLLQVAGLVFTVWQVRLVIGIRSMLWRRLTSTVGQLTEAGHQLLGRTPTKTVEVAASFGFNVSADFEVRHPGESETEWLTREVRQNRQALAELERKVSDLDARSQRELDDRLAELERETTAEAKRNAELMWWGVALIGAGIVAQTVGSVI